MGGVDVVAAAPVTGPRRAVQSKLWFAAKAGSTRLAGGRRPGTVGRMDDYSAPGDPTGAGGVDADLALVAWDNARRLFRLPVGEANLDEVEATAGLLLALRGGLHAETVNAAVRAAIGADLDFRLAPWLRLGV